MAKATIITNIDEVQRKYDTIIAGIEEVANSFFQKHRNRIMDHAVIVVRQVVYDVQFFPEVYERTYNLLNSITSAYGDPQRRSLIIYSDPNIAKAKTVAGGYAKYVAGVPSLGFLKPKYGDRVSYFPRDWLSGILHLSSPVFNSIQVDVQKLFEDEVREYLKKVLS